MFNFLLNLKSLTAVSFLTFAAVNTALAVQFLFVFAVLYLVYIMSPIAT